MTFYDLNTLYSVWPQTHYCYWKKQTKYENMRRRLERPKTFVFWGDRPPTSSRGVVPAVLTHCTAFDDSNGPGFWVVIRLRTRYSLLFILTSARKSIPFVAVPTLAAETAGWVCTRGVRVAWEILVAETALVNVRTLESIQMRVPNVALARIRAGRVHANRRVQVTVVPVRAPDARTLVHVCT